MSFSKTNPFGSQISFRMIQIYKTMESIKMKIKTRNFRQKLMV